MWYHCSCYLWETGICQRLCRIASGLLINVSELTKTFTSPDGNNVVAVDQVSFHVSRGEAYGLLGANGAGKTTTLRMILGLLRPTSGDSTIDGASVAVEPDRVKRLIGFVSTSVGVYQWLSPREMLSFVADLYDVAPELAAERIDSLSRLLNFRGYLDRRCGVLSTGQKQRINLARALMHDPPVMLLDEPTRGLDIVGSQVVFEFIQHLRQDGKAVIICTHRLDEAERFADRFGLLHHGQLKYAGTLDELRSATDQKSLTDMFIQLLNTNQDGVA